MITIPHPNLIPSPQGSPASPSASPWIESSRCRFQHQGPQWHGARPGYTMDTKRKSIFAACSDLRMTYSTPPTPKFLILGAAPQTKTGTYGRQQALSSGFPPKASLRIFFHSLTQQMTPKLPVSDETEITLDF